MKKQFRGIQALCLNFCFVTSFILSTSSSSSSSSSYYYYYYFALLCAKRRKFHLEEGIATMGSSVLGNMECKKQCLF